MAAEIEVLFRDHIRAQARVRHKTAASLGAAPTGALERAAQSPEATGDAEGVLLALRPGELFARAFGDVEILPRNGRFLTIPASARSYGERIGQVMPARVRQREANARTAPRDRPVPGQGPGNRRDPLLDGAARAPEAGPHAAARRCRRHRRGRGGGHGVPSRPGPAAIRRGRCAVSRLMDICAAVKARLEESGSLAGVPVVINRQMDLESDIDAAIGKLDICVVLYPTRARRGPGSMTPDPYAATVIAEVYASPLLRDKAVVAIASDDAAEAVADALDGWIPEGGATWHTLERVCVTDIELVPDRKYLVWRVTASVSYFIGNT